MDLVLAVLIVIAVQLVSFLVLRGRIHQELNATTLLKDVRDEVDGMVRELNLSAERNIGLLEARIEEMESALAQADQKLVLLARETEKRDKSADVYTQLRRVVPDIEPQPLDPPVEAELPAEPETVVYPPVPAAPSAPAPVQAPAEPPRARSLKEKVLELRDMGADPGAIASASGATRAEVELILSLNPRG